MIILCDADHMTMPGVMLDNESASYRRTPLFSTENKDKPAAPIELFENDIREH